jgi:hypothetical protein
MKIKAVLIVNLILIIMLFLDPEKIVHSSSS